MNYGICICVSFPGAWLERCYVCIHPGLHGTINSVGFTNWDYENEKDNVAMSSWRIYTTICLALLIFQVEVLAQEHVGATIGGGFSKICRYPGQSF